MRRSAASPTDLSLSHVTERQAKGDYSTNDKNSLFREQYKREFDLCGHFDFCPGYKNVKQIEMIVILISKEGLDVNGLFYWVWEDAVVCETLLLYPEPRALISNLQKGRK
jgi:hypothetical protein